MREGVIVEFRIVDSDASDADHRDSPVKIADGDVSTAAHS